MWYLSVNGAIIQCSSFGGIRLLEVTNAIFVCGLLKVTNAVFVCDWTNDTAFPYGRQLLLANGRKCSVGLSQEQ